ncbi:winged helix-turn-helix transcriptional regulator [Aquamicrobium terrae]
MMVIFHGTGEKLRRDILHTAWIGIGFQYADAVQDFSSLLYRDPDALGILHCHLPDMVAQIVRGIRLGNVKNRLLVTFPEVADIEKASKLRGDVLFAGADDVQPATIDEREVVARLKALQRRGDYVDHIRIALPGAVFVSTRCQIETKDGRSLRVYPKASAILVELARRPGEVRTKQQIMDALYGGEDEPEIKVIDVLVCKLRQKIMEATGGLDVIQCVWGRGYQFVPEGFRPERKAGRRRWAI